MTNILGTFISRFKMKCWKSNILVDLVPLCPQIKTADMHGHRCTLQKVMSILIDYKGHRIKGSEFASQNEEKKQSHTYWTNCCTSFR